jgi:general secretion pathway protein E
MRGSRYARDDEDASVSSKTAEPGQAPAAGTRSLAERLRAAGLVIDLRWALDELVADGALTQRDANLCLGTPRDKHELNWHPLQFIAKLQFTHAGDPAARLTMDWLGQWLADKAGVPWFHLDPLKINVAKVAEVMSYKFAERHHILCVQSNKDDVVIATDQPFATGWMSQIEQTLRGREMRLVVANPDDLARYRLEFYNLSRSIARAGSEGQSGSGIVNFEQLLEMGKASADANDHHIVAIVDWILQYAFEQRASDIHLEPRRETGKMRFRIDGVLHDVYELPAMIMTAVTARLKILGRLNVAEKRKPQDGRLKTRSPAGDEIELRLSTLPTAFGEKMVMRIFDPEVLLRSFEQLGLAAEDLQKWNQMVDMPHGIVFVTGPTGSGKTTTLYSTLKRLATPDVNVCTIEDPIEMVEPSFNQMQVQANIDVGFAEGVKALLRQDPDIIMIGEIRDLPTADVAVQAALTGHLVLSTLHTNDAPSSVTRLVDLGVPPYLISATVNGVMAQRLVRTLCPHCKKETDTDEAVWKELVAPFKSRVPAKVYLPGGCLECRDTGYLGRMGVYEIMLLSPAMKKLISQRADVADIRRLAVKEGMRPLRLSGAQKVAAGLTTIEEVMRLTPAMDMFD